MAEYAINGDIATLLGGDHTTGDPAALWVECSQPILIVEGEGRIGGKIRIPLASNGTFTVTGLPESIGGTTPLYRLHYDSKAMRVAGKRSGEVTKWFPLTTNRDLTWIIANYVDVTTITPEVAANIAAAAALGATNDTATASFISNPESDTYAVLQRRADDLAGHPLARFHAALAMREQRPCRIVTLGSSTTYGSVATTRGREWTSLLLRRLQAAYPSRIPGNEAAAVRFSEAGTANPLPGAQLVNGAVAGSTSATYCQSLTLLGIATHDPALVIHMIGSNDSVPGGLYISPSDYRSNVAAAIDAIDAQQNAAGQPTSHVLIHTFRRWQTTVASWAEYAQGLHDIAAERTNVLVVDNSAQFERLDMYGANPFGVMSADTVHLTDNGHALVADLTARALDLGQPAGEDRRVVLADSFTRIAAAPGSPELPANRAYEVASGGYTMGAGRVVHTSGGTLLVDSGISDVDASVVINTGSGSPLAGLVFKADSDTNRLGMFINRASQVLTLYKTDGGSTTVLKSEPYTFAADTDYLIRAVAIGASVLGYVNGALVLSFTLAGDDPTQYGAYTKVGVRCGSPTTGLHYRGLCVRRP